MSDHSILIDLQAPGFPTFECYAPDDSPCHAKWDCECENVWNYRVVGGSPVHDTTPEGMGRGGNAIHVGRFDNTACSLSEWHDNSDEPVSGAVRVSVTPVYEIDYTVFEAVGVEMAGWRRG